MPVKAATSNPKLSVTLPSDREIVLTREFNAPRRLVFEVWTTREHVMQWWAGCDGNTLMACEIDLRVGGVWWIVVRGADGGEYTVKGVYREVVVPERLVHTQVLDVETHSRGEALVTVVFEDLAGGTRITETILHVGLEFVVRRRRAAERDSGNRTSIAYR